jgi:mannose-1-phosphate guanylyltransferase
MAAGQQWALVLAGGDGMRLRALTRALTGRPVPKQYCRITGDCSLLEATLARIAPLVPRARTLVIVNRDHLAFAARQLRSLPPDNVIVQPRNCDTGPGMLLSLLTLARRAPDARLAVFPSDHYVADQGAFLHHVERAARLAARRPGRIVLLGIPPERPERHYGYIEPGSPLRFPDDGEAHGVSAFHEKPDPAEAVRLVRRGGLWNSFVMAFQLRPVLSLLARLRPDDFGQMKRLVVSPGRIDDVYRSLMPWNFSSGFLARVVPHLAVVRAEDTGWSDWGTRRAIEQTFAILRLVPPWRRRLPGRATA